MTRYLRYLRIIRDPASPTPTARIEQASVTQGGRGDGRRIRGMLRPRRRRHQHGYACSDSRHGSTSTHPGTAVRTAMPRCQSPPPRPAPARRHHPMHRERRATVGARCGGSTGVPQWYRGRDSLSGDARAPAGARSPSRSSSGRARAAPTTSTWRKRARISSHRTRSCISARRLPMQKWTPQPKERCWRAFSRSIRNSFGALEDRPRRDWPTRTT